MPAEQLIGLTPDEKILRVASEKRFWIALSEIHFSDENENDEILDLHSYDGN